MYGGVAIHRALEAEIAFEPTTAPRGPPPYSSAMASAAAVPPALEAQLVEGGRLVVPVDDGDQRLVVIQRSAAGFERRALERVRFVPLI